MRLTALLFTAVLLASSAEAQPPPPSSPPDASSAPKDAAQAQGPQGSPKPGAEPRDGQGLPVSLDKIKEALEQTPLIAPLRGLNETPVFKIEVRERQRISLDDLLKSLDFKAGPVPGGGLYGFEQQRQMFPAVDNPLRQPYAAFSQGELLTILAENLVGKYLAGRALNAISAAERAHAQSAAHAEVQQAVREYCAAQPLGGAGIIICTNPVQ
jgi:hypothetical protein